MGKARSERRVGAFVPYLNSSDLDKSLAVVRAIRHPLRQKMLQYIHAQQEMTVTDLYIQLRMEQSLASQHLALLRQAGVVKTRREGKFIFYSIDYERLEQLSKLFAQIAALTTDAH
ncbi:MAG: metalloregulator ArsR/SmtB family transcription factor [Saprospiraceae bacterium]|nr:metalloregulator ArsR/SmtB family transcription factor [Saprospiraceae bacterium]MDW8484748.1 metalloregulator ArsR/SmtB family transcription factor [Saprospiraceae bacterium]